MKQGDSHTETQPFRKGSAAAPAQPHELPCSSEVAAAAYGFSWPRHFPEHRACWAAAGSEEETCFRAEILGFISEHARWLPESSNSEKHICMDQRGSR